jgi:hypothetical protein
MTRRRRRQAGSALPAALAAVAVSAALAGALAELTRIEVIVARQRQSAAAALAAVDACLAGIVVAIPPGWDFASLLAGPDGVTGSADDGQLSTRPGCQASARAAASAVHLTVAGDASGGRRTLDALVGRDRSPGLESLLWLGEPPAAGTISGALQLDGADPADPAAPDRASLAAPAAPPVLDAWSRGEAPHLVASPHTGLPVRGAPPPLALLDTRLRAALPAGAEALVATGPPPPTLALVAGDLTVPGTLYGAGLLLVEGTLDVAGSLDFAGVVIATRGVRVGAGARLTVDGTLWVGASSPPGQGLLVDGDLLVRHRRAPLDAADALLGLPRRAIVLGLRDLG